MTNFLNQIGQNMMATALFHDENQALAIFKASLLALRDRLNSEESFHLGCRLPEQLREEYFIDWNRDKNQTISVNKSEFLAEVAFHLGDYDLSLGDLVPVALHEVLKLVDLEEANHVKHSIPRSMQDIFDYRQEM